MQRFWTTVADHLRAGRRVFVALVAAHELHSPGTAGARLLVPAEGAPFGSVGGGIMEHRLVERAQALLSEGHDWQPHLQVLDHRGRGLGEPSGLVCAGGQTNLYLLCLPERDLGIVEQIAQLLEQDRPGLLTITPDGLRVEAHSLDIDGQAIVLEEEGASWRYEEQILNRQRLAILGGGHCSLALSRQMHWLGFDVRVFDTRPDIASFERNDFARTIRIEDYREAGAQIPFPTLTDVVLMTNAYEADVQALLGVLPHPFPYIGLMGSDAKIGRVFSALRKAGVGREALGRVTAPVGLPIESDTPEEIAVSVAAQVIRRRKLEAEAVHRRASVAAG